MIGHSPFDGLVGASLGRYRLEELIEDGELGPIFTARGEAAQGLYRVRLLAAPTTLGPQARNVYQERFQREVGQIATLQHPYLLPLLDSGLSQDLPYLVWPYASLRSLGARLIQSGPLDMLTVGRYLDQIAAALEYAHEHAVLHRNLTTDCIFVRPDGHVVVADLGVRHLLELTAEDGRSSPLLGNGEACAPEQIFGGPVTPATDVYALGAIVYGLLSGHPVFTGSTSEEVLQQHLSAAVPSLSRWRRGLPAGLDGLLATAMAKEPTQRFAHPGALANAYHEIVSPNNPARVPFLTGATGAPAPTRRSDGSPTRTSRPVAAESAAGSPRLGASAPAQPAQAAAGMRSRPQPLAQQRAQRSRLARNAVFGALVAIIIGASALGLAALNGSFSPAPAVSGVALFVDSPQGPPERSDALDVTIHGLHAPASGYSYDAWLASPPGEQLIPLGSLKAQHGTYTLSYTGDGTADKPGTNLLAIGNKVEVTLEHGPVTLPVGTVELSGSLPPQALVHIRHLLVSFPTTPGQIGLVVGVLDQTRIANTQAQVLQSATASRNPVAVACATQSLLDILEGLHGANYRALPSQCAALDITLTGDGFGLLGQGDYLDTAADHASYAATTPDATGLIKTHAGHVQVAIANIQGWLTKVDQDAVNLLKDPTNTTVVSDIVTLTDHAYHGVEINGEQVINPVPGQAGALTAYDHAQFMATLPLAPGR